MEQTGKVLRNWGNGMVQVVILRQSACSGDCHKCAGCGAVEQKVLLDAHNPIGASIGDTVTVRTESGPVLAGAAILYLLPVVLFFAGYLLGAALWQKGGLAGGVGFIIGLALAAVYERLVVKKQKTVYTITGFAQNLSES